MKVVVFSQYFWPESFRINDLVKSLLDRKVDVEIVTGQPNYPLGKVYPGYTAWKTAKQVFAGTQLHRVPLAPRGTGSALRLVANYLSFVLSGAIFAPFLMRRKKVDIIFVYAISPILAVIPAIILKWVKGAKLVVWVQDLWPESLEATGFIRNKTVLAMVGVLVRWIYRNTDLILVQSEAFIPPVAQLAKGRTIRYYPNSADDVFTTSSLDDTPQVAGLGDGFSVVFAGNLGTAQSVETIVEAAILLKDNKNIRIFLIGQGSRVDWINEQIALHGLSNITMPGHFPLQAMPPILRRAGALLVSLKDEPIFSRTLPSKLQAYLAVGRPIIASINGEGARIVEQARVGISCEAENAQALASAITDLASRSPAELQELGQNGQRYFAEHYDSDTLTQTLIDHFEGLLKEKVQS